MDHAPVAASGTHTSRRACAGATRARARCHLQQRHPCTVQLRDRHRRRRFLGHSPGLHATRRARPIGASRRMQKVARGARSSGVDRAPAAANGIQRSCRAGAPLTPYPPCARATRPRALCQLELQHLHRRCRFRRRSSGLHETEASRSCVSPQSCRLTSSNRAGTALLPWR